MADIPIDGCAHLVTLVLGQVDIFTAFMERNNLYNIPRPNWAAVCHYKLNNMAYTFHIFFCFNSVRFENISYVTRSLIKKFTYKIKEKRPGRKVKVHCRS